MTSRKPGTLHAQRPQRTYTEDEVAALLKQAADYVDHKLVEQWKRDQEVLDERARLVRGLRADLSDFRRRVSERMRELKP